MRCLFHPCLLPHRDEQITKHSQFNCDSFNTLSIRLGDGRPKLLQSNVLRQCVPPGLELTLDTHGMRRAAACTVGRGTLQPWRSRAVPCNHASRPTHRFELRSTNLPSAIRTAQEQYQQRNQTMYHSNLGGTLRTTKFSLSLFFLWGQFIAAPPATWRFRRTPNLAHSLAQCISTTVLHTRCRIFWRLEGHFLWKKKWERRKELQKIFTWEKKRRLWGFSNPLGRRFLLFLCNKL